MGRIQDDFNARSGDFQLAPGEYEGPLVISRPCVVDGGAATLWASGGPVLVIDAPGVTVKNLRVEVTEQGEDPGVVIRSNFPDAVLDGVEVNGDVVGISTEASGWKLPSVIALGNFAAGEVNTFSYELDVPMDAQLLCAMKDITVSPAVLRRGRNRIVIRTHEIRANTILYGEIMVKSTVSRRVYILGKAEAGAPVRQDAMPVSEAPAASVPVVCSAPPEVIAPPPAEDAPVRTVVRGQRLPAKELPSQTVKIVFACKGRKRPLDVDGYVFLLQDGGKVGGDGDLIFFGNPVSAGGGVSAGSSGGGQPLVIVQLDKLEERVCKISVCFSIYGDDLAENFSLVDEPSIRVLAGEMDFCRFPLAGLGTEKTVVAMEIYRYKGEWKIHFVGAGYNSGLQRLCESYGVEIE